jgi:SMI1 / KNR4 family (SUKH-1)
MRPHQTLQAWWFQTAAGIVPQATPQNAIAALEARYSITLPDDFRTYLLESVPKEENWDDEYGNWWPMSRIKNIPDEYEHAVSEPIASNASKHLIFLDYSIWCWAWAISCADDETRGKIAIIGGSPDGYVADTFEEFVERYTSDWGAISQAQKSRL